MKSQIRTLGDGMENALLSPNLKSGTATSTINLNTFHVKISELVTKNILKSLKSNDNVTKTPMVPKYAPKEIKVLKFSIKKPKEPKFVPYEPFKAAVTPICPKKIVNSPMKPAKKDKNNIELQVLVKQLSEMRETELHKFDIIECKIENAEQLKLQWEKEKESYENDIKNLRETNAHLQNQLKFHAQVNSELKTLLVAAIGEDLESRVQHLTEDKLSLARALLNSANHLTSHQEQTEWLSGQCEVWRSKFLASSLMVEELAKWKSALSNRLNQIQDIVKSLLDERKNIYNESLKCYSSLKSTREKIDNGKQVHLKFGNILEVVKINQILSNDIKTLLNVQEEKSGINEFNKSDLDQYTVAEKNALKLLQNPVRIANKQDALCDAVMGAASSVGGRTFLQNPSLHSCCSHCKGEVLNI